jgi:hypothetical protein
VFDFLTSASCSSSTSSAAGDCTGHSRPSNIADLVAYRTFLETLRAEVLQARREGRSVAEMKKTITMPAYREWLNYESWLPPSIENMNGYLDRIGAK